MKVNVLGRGFVQGVGLLPQRNIELGEMSVRRLFNFRNCKVYLASTGELLTPAYFDKKKAEATKAAEAKKTAVPTTPVVAPKAEIVEPKPYTAPEVVVEEKVEEPAIDETPVAEEIVEVPVEEAPVFTEEVEAPAIEEPAEEVAEITEIADEADSAEKDEKPHYNGGKKKNRHR